MRVWICVSASLDAIMISVAIQHLSRSSVHRAFGFSPTMISLVRRRSRQKGPDPQFGLQEPTVGSLELGNEDVGAKRQVYLVTFPHPRAGSCFAVPSSVSR